MYEYQNRIESIMDQLGRPSLKAFAGVFGITPVRIYTVAKQPKEGVVYDAKVFNWDAIERFIKRRLDPDKGLATLEDVVKAALVVEADLRARDGRRKSTSTNVQIEVDGKMIPKRRYASFEQENGQPIVLKKDPEIYGIVLQTQSYTVLRPLNSADIHDYKGNDVKLISNVMLNIKGIGPSALEEEVRQRLFQREQSK